MENYKPVNELVEQIMRRFREAWDDLVDTIKVDRVTREEKNELNKLKEEEYNKLLVIYEEQKLPPKALAQILARVENSKTNAEKLAIFYKYTFYNSKGTREENNKESFEIAEDFTNKILSNEDKKSFKEAMNKL